MRGFDGPIHIALCRSGLFFVRGVLLAHFLALILLVRVMPGSVGLVVLLVAIAANAGCTVWSLHRGGGDVRAILLTARGRWQLTLRDGRNVAAVPTRPPLVSAGLIVISLRCADRRIRHVVLLADNAPPEPCRRLRVRLLHGAGAGAVTHLAGR